jgi:carbon storage regulator CsrA
MLVLSRKPNEALHVGDNIVITVTRVRGDVVRLGIEAPRDVKIMRGELVGKPDKKSGRVQIGEKGENPSDAACASGELYVDEEDPPAISERASSGPQRSGPLAMFLQIARTDLAAAS